MRVTDRKIFDDANRLGARARERMANATETAASGLRVQKASDDPGAAGRITLHRQETSRSEAIAQSAARASDELATADGALEVVGNAITRARELAVQLSNGSYNASDRKLASGEAAAVLQQAIAALNTQIGGRFLFGGTRDDLPPFDAGGAYSGDQLVRQVELAPGVVQDASLRADVVVKGAAGGVDALATMQALATALAANDLTGIQGAIGNLDKATDQLATGRAHVGAAMLVFDDAHEFATSVATMEKTAAAYLEQADPVDAFSQLALAQRGLEAAIAATAQSFRLTLLGQLK